MAHAGTPTDLAKQPATSTPNGLWQALLVAVVLVALVAGMVIVGTSLAARGAVSPAAIPAANHSYDQIEAQRGTATLSMDEYLNGILDRAHAAPFAAGAVTPQVSATSGTFHPGWQATAPATRDRVGGP